MDPCQLYADEESIRNATEQMIKSFGKRHIANLGHGVYPDTELNKVQVFIETIKNFKYSK
jgi:uroporphyrinogen decarboxylase